MNMLGFFLLASGLPCIAMGVYFRKQPPPETGGGKKQKKRKDKKKGKGGGKKKDDEPRPQPREGGSLIFGGLAICLVGVGLIVKELVTK